MSTTAAPRSPWAILAVALSGTFLYGFDQNVVNVALPSLQADLGAGQVSLQLIVGGYAFSYATGLLTGGRLGDLVGHRRMFMIGMAAFTLVSICCGLAPAPGVLVAARLFQGLAASLMVPQVLALITITFPPDLRPRALGWFGVIAAVSGIAGQVLGGLLLVSDVLGLGWRVIFLLNLPVGLLALLAASIVLPRTPSRPSALDIPGMLMISVSLALLLIPLTIGRSVGWAPWTWLLMIMAVPALFGSLAYERRVAERGGAPLIQLSLFGYRSFRAGLAASATMLAYFTGTVFVFSLVLQEGLGLSAFAAGLTFAPMAIVSMITAQLAPRLVPRLGASRLIALGAAVDVVGSLVLIGDWLIRRDVDLVVLITAFVIIRIGNMLALPQLIGASLIDVSPEQAGAGSGMLTMTQQFGASAGLAVLGTIFFAALGDQTRPAAYAAAMTATMIGASVLLIILGTTALIFLTPVKRPERVTADQPR